MKVKIEKAPLSKDGTAFAPDSMFQDTRDGWRQCIGDSTRWDAFAAAVVNDHIENIVVITSDNVMYVFTKEGR